MSERYPIPAASRHREETSIKRSRFIVTLAHASDEAGAREFVKSIKAEFPNASHNCWAFQCGPPGDTARAGMSDDGEPSGTAGRPMLTVLLHSGVGEIAAVVTRYFGGTKLGTGGLVKAYTQLVKQGLDTLPRKEKIPTSILAFSLQYASIKTFKNLLRKHEARIIREDFGAAAAFTVKLPRARQQAFEQAARLQCGAVAAPKASEESPLTDVNHYSHKESS